MVALTNALMKCKKTASACVQAELNKPPTSTLLGFKGWQKDQGPYPLILKRYQEGVLKNHTMKLALTEY